MITPHYKVCICLDFIYISTFFHMFCSHWCDRDTNSRADETTVPLSQHFLSYNDRHLLTWSSEGLPVLSPCRLGESKFDRVGLLPWRPCAPHMLQLAGTSPVTAQNAHEATFWPVTRYLPLPWPGCCRSIAHSFTWSAPQRGLWEPWRGSMGVPPGERGRCPHNFVGGPAINLAKNLWLAFDNSLPQIQSLTCTETKQRVGITRQFYLSSIFRTLWWISCRKNSHRLELLSLKETL